MTTHRKITVLDSYSHVVMPDFDGLSRVPWEVDGQRLLGVADFVPNAAFGRRGKWVITVEFEDPSEVDVARMNKRGWKFHHG